MQTLLFTSLISACLVFNSFLSDDDLPADLKNLQKEFLDAIPKKGEDEEATNLLNTMRNKVRWEIGDFHRDSSMRLISFIGLTMLSRDGHFGIAGFKGNDRLPSLMLKYGIDSCTVAKFKILMPYVSDDINDSNYVRTHCKDFDIDSLTKKSIYTGLTNKTIKGLKEGYWINKRNSGVIESEGFYKNGKREGLWKEYEDDGTIYNEGNYINDQKEGKWYLISRMEETLLDECRYSKGIFIEGSYSCLPEKE